MAELKCVDKLLPIHEAQLLTYMKLANINIGLLINFNEKLLKRGIKRLVLSYLGLIALHGANAFGPFVFYQ